jgi:hypothetical protein
LCERGRLRAPRSTANQELTVGFGTMHTVKALYYVSKLFGLSPFKLRTHHFTLKVIFETKLRENVLYSLWSLFLIIMMIFGEIIQINMVIKSITASKNFVGDFPGIFSFFSSTSSWIFVNLKRLSARLILKQLYKFDFDLLEYEYQVRKSKGPQYVFLTKISLLLFPTIVVMTLTFIFFRETFGHFYLTVLWTSYLISSMVLIHVLGILSFLHHDLATLNIGILSFVKHSPQRTSSHQTKYKHAVSSRVARHVSRNDNTNYHHISVINNNYSRSLVCGTPMNQHSVSSKILSLRNTYSSIYDLLGDISSIYGFPVLVELTQNIVMLVAASYSIVYFLHSYQTHGPHPGFEFSFVATFVLWLVVTFIRLLVITVTCENLRSENKRLSDSVHKLLLQQDMAADSVQQLQLFSFQLLSCKMEFSAAGLFSVDLPYLYSAIAAIVTYIVVLIQLNQFR